MKQKKRAWVYCRIDAPEDKHGTLKGQRQQLMDYADQMGFAVIGSSEDLSGGHTLIRPGLKRFMEAVDADSVDVLLIIDITRIGRDTCQTMAWLEHLQQKKVSVYSPLEGRLSFSFQKMVQNVMVHIGVEQQ